MCLKGYLPLPVTLFAGAQYTSDLHPVLESGGSENIKRAYETAAEKYTSIIF